MLRVVPCIAVAPMIAYTDRHYRYLARLLSPHITLYSEMVTANALLHSGETSRYLFHQAGSPSILQLGGSCPEDLARCAQLAQAYQYDGINLNVGCPSERVQSGAFGACLMREAPLVRDCVAAMRASCALPVTVKTRLGIDNDDSYSFLQEFIEIVSDSCNEFIIHARKAWLKGLSPRQNRSVPPINYPRVYQLKKDFPHLSIHLNGEIKTVEDITTHLQLVDGIMLGRAIYNQPKLFAEIEQTFYQGQAYDAAESLKKYGEYIEQQLEQGVALKVMLRHVMPLLQGLAGARSWRARLSDPSLTARDYPKLQDDLLAFIALTNGQHLP